MPRVKITLPAFHFSAIIPVRITDLNYGNHVGNDAILSLVHEARMQFLGQWGYTEMEMGGVGMIMRDAAIDFKSELFYGDKLTIHVAATEFSKIGFDLYYKLEKMNADKPVLVAAVKTAMICYDYSLKKIASLPDEVRTRMTS